MPKSESENAKTKDVEEKPPAEDDSTPAPTEPPKPKPRTKKAVDLPVVERRNWLLHQHFVRKDFESCKHLIKEQLTQTGGECEYALYVQAMILRSEGKIAESTDLLQACANLNPTNVDNMKQMARNFFLLGKYKNSIDCYKHAADLCDGGDWEISHHLGVCYLHLKQYDAAEESLKESLMKNKHDITYSTLASLYLETNRMDKAVEILKKGIEFAPEHIDMLTTLGLLYLRMQNFHRAFELLGQAMTFDPENYKAILATGSLMQVHGDFDVALTKYRVAAQKAPESAALWNNIGMCFYGKKKYVAAISCLKRATYLAPFDWKILYNLSLLHCTMQQYASAFQFASSALKLKPKSGQIYMLLAIALNHLGDVENAKKSYEEALSLQPNDVYATLNYATFLHDNKEDKQAQKVLRKLESLLQGHDADPNTDKEVLDTARKLGAALQIGDKFLQPPDQKSSKDKKEKKKSTKRSTEHGSKPVATTSDESSPMPSASSTGDTQLPQSDPKSPTRGNLPPLKARSKPHGLTSRVTKSDINLVDTLPDTPKQLPEGRTKKALESPLAE